MFVRAYLRASTQEQDASRARQQLEAFATERGLTVASWYTENESGASLKRPKLFELLGECQKGDILLLEQVDRLTRLTETDWQTLKAAILEKHVHIMSLDLPTSWKLPEPSSEDVTDRITSAVNNMLLDLLAAVARKDYTDRRRRQAQGIAKAKDAGVYQGRPENTERNATITGLLQKGISWTEIQKATKCSRSTLARLAKAARESKPVEPCKPYTATGVSESLARLKKSEARKEARLAAEKRKAAKQTTQTEM